MLTSLKPSGITGLHRFLRAEWLWVKWLWLNTFSWLSGLFSKKPEPAKPITFACERQALQSNNEIKNLKMPLWQGFAKRLLPYGDHKESGRWDFCRAIFNFKYTQKNRKSMPKQCIIFINVFIYKYGIIIFMQFVNDRQFWCSVGFSLVKYIAPGFQNILPPRQNIESSINCLSKPILLVNGLTGWKLVS